MTFGYQNHFRFTYSCRQGRHGEAGCARPSVLSLSIPRLRKADTARSSEEGNYGLVILHYTGKKHVNPPAVPLVTSGPSYEDVERTTLSLSRAQEKDTQWLNSLFRSSEPMEWGGFNSQLARQSIGCNKRGPYMYLFGPPINAPPAHADTVLTSVMYMMQSLTDLRMTYIHLSPDMQLYIQALHMKWNEPQAFDKLILRPGVMHIVQNVCGCIGQLMMGSGLADLIGAAFGGVGSIVDQGEPWVRAMRSFRMVSSVILQSFLQAGFKTWDEICEYLPAMAKDDILSGAFVCRHKAGNWNAVSADQFGEQTAIKIGKGGLKGITLSQEQVAEWIDSFPISAYVSDALDHCYSPDQANSSCETPHREGCIKRRKVDTDDRRRISEELDKCSHPMEIESDVLYNIVNGQVAPAVVNVSDALSLGALMVTDFRKSLPAGFHAKLSSPVKTMEKLKHGIKIGDQVVFDLESIFLRLLLVGQQREMELLPIFGYERCAVPPSLVDEYGCLRKGNKAVLMHRLE